MSQPSAAQELRARFRPTRLAFRWWNPHREPTQPVKQQMADAVQADAASLTVKARIYSPALGPIRAITALKGAITQSWKDHTRPFAEDGVRLLPRADLADFEQRMEEFAAQLQERAAQVQAARSEIIEEARQRLQAAFNPNNYPHDLAALFGLEWSYPSIAPAGDLPAEIYQRQEKALQAKLEEALHLAEAAFLTEFQELVAALHERLTPTSDGQKKVFRDSAIGNLTDFFRRFRKLNLGENPDLEKLIAEAQDLVGGLSAKDLRASGLLRQETAAGLGQIKHQLAGLVVPAPRRKVVKPQPQPAVA